MIICHGFVLSLTYVSAAVLKPDKEKKGASNTSEGQLSWTAVEIAQAKSSDLDIIPVIARIKERKPKPSHDELSHTSQISRQYAHRVVLPEPLVRPALQWLHDGLEGSHLGQLKTLHKVQTRFWRPGLSKIVKDHCAACLTCAEYKRPGKMPKAPLHPIPSTYPRSRRA